MATYTSTVFSSQPKQFHVGVEAVSGQINLAAQASSNGDVLFLCKIPHGAVIVSFDSDHTTGATTQVLDFGFATGGTDGGGASFSALVSGGAQATFNRRNVRGLTPRVSVSDNDTNRWAALAAKVVSGSATTSLIVSWNVTYRNDA